VPQIRKLRTTGDTAGVSWAWAVLTSVNNAAWLAYCTLEHYWTALVPSISATTLAGALAILLSQRKKPRRKEALPIAAGTWLLIGGELCCWLTLGLHKSDPRLIALGLTGITASTLMLARIRARTSRVPRPACPGSSWPSTPRRARGPAGASAASGAAPRPG
jgi:hypothetical protein